MHIRQFLGGALATLLAIFLSLVLTLAPQAQDGAVLRGKAAFGSWHDDAPGKRRHIQANDLPVPSPSRANGVRVIAQPRNTTLKVPPGFEVRQFASGLSNPRTLRVAPNGDIFVAET